MKTLSMMVLLALIMAVHALAGAPELLNYQGRLTTPAGQPVADGAYSVKFTIYDDSLSGAVQWAETLQVTTNNGLFNVLLGSIHPVQVTVFASPNRWLSIAVGVDPEITPRTRFTSVAYALQSGTDGTGLWSANGDDVYRLTGNVGIGTDSPMATLNVEGRAKIGGLGFIPSYAEIMFNAYQSTSGVVYTVDGSAFSLAHDRANDRLHFKYAPPGLAGNPVSFDRAMIINSSGDVGIGTTTPIGRLDVRGGPIVAGYPGGQIRITGGTGDCGLWTGGSDVLRIADWETGTKGLAVNYTTGNVGVGTTSPRATLDVNGTVGISLAINPRSALDVGGTISATDALRIYGDNVHFHEIKHNYVSGDLEINPIEGVDLIITHGNVGIGTTNPTAKLHVVGDLCVTGQKNALVPTSQGMTKVYSEESAEVWFTDYGKARLADGKCHIDLDPLFLETVTINDKNPMMVFLQEEDECNGLIVKPDLTGFDVIEKSTGQSDAQFSYRIVAKRKGQEGARLESVQTAAIGGAK